MRFRGQQVHEKNEWGENNINRLKQAIRQDVLWCRPYDRREGEADYIRMEIFSTFSSYLPEQSCTLFLLFTAIARLSLRAETSMRHIHSIKKYYCVF